MKTEKEITKPKKRILYKKVEKKQITRKNIKVKPSDLSRYRGGVVHI